MADAGRETFPVRPRKSVPQLRQQVVVAEAPILAHPAADGLAHVGQHVPVRPPEPLAAGRPQRLRRLLQAVECVEQRVLGQGEALLHGLGKLCPAVAADQLGRREARLGGGEQRLQPVEILLDPV